jgi:amino acid permease
MGTAVLMMKTQIGLGVLSIPKVFDALGLVPGVICLLTIAGITTWSDYMVGVFKLNHRHVYGIDDAGQLMFGRVGREIFAFTFCLCRYTLIAI